MRFLREDGSPAASFPVHPGERDGPTAEFEILRGELSRILIEHSRTNTDYRFDTQIADLTHHGDHTTVALDDGSTIDADLVVIRSPMPAVSPRASSPSSPTTRRCTFPPSAR
jgi:2-polyprenyl-6-methoxyphenol hydroxylase-like FAD-dependent oxidoreductase